MSTVTDTTQSGVWTNGEFTPISNASEFPEAVIDFVAGMLIRDGAVRRDGETLLWKTWVWDNDEEEHPEWVPATPELYFQNHHTLTVTPELARLGHYAPSYDVSDDEPGRQASVSILARALKMLEVNP